MDASILVVAFLLVAAACVASYLLSQWSAIRNSGLGIGWIAMSVGITLLLAAAAIVVLMVGLFPGLQLSQEIEAAIQMRTSRQFGSGTPERALDRHEAPTTNSADEARDHSVIPVADKSTAERHSDHRSGIAMNSAPQSVGAPRRSESAAATRGGLAPAEPWAATNCVAAINLDPTDRTRWIMENECDAPVGLVFASCWKSRSECDDWQSTAWEYQIDGMILPAKMQRPVTFAEQTQRGSQIRYIACSFASPRTIMLIAENMEVRSSSAWLEQFSVARNYDECLMRVQEWSTAGRRSGRSIDALLGPDAPGRVRSSSSAAP